MTLIPDQLRWTAEHHPDEIGFTVAGVGAVTLGEWHAASSAFARGLVARGLQSGDRVALALTPQDGLRFVVAYAAVHKAGGVAVPINVRMSPVEVRGVLHHCEPAVVVTSAELRHLVDSDTSATATVIAARPAERCAAGDVPWDEVPSDDSDDLQVPRDADDLAEILYTSGTTSTPKGVAVRHSNSALFLFGKPQWTSRPWLHASPMFTMAGLTFVYQPMRMGLSTTYLPRFKVDAWLQLLADERPANCFLVPSMVELLLADPATYAADWSVVDMVSVGSAPIAPATLLRLQELVPDALVTNAYSMTEAGTAYFIMPKGELVKHPGAVGQPVPPAEVRIVDDADVVAALGEIGNVQVKPAGRMREYYREPEASQDVFHGDGWLRTGDLGRFDDDGYLYIVGRAKDVIIRGGLNVHASDVEGALYEHEAVEQAAVVGASHPILGEEVVAFVVVKQTMRASAEELMEFCRGRLADYAVPRRVHFCDELPRNATGKVLKRELVERADHIAASATP